MTATGPPEPHRPGGADRSGGRRIRRRPPPVPPEFEQSIGATSRRLLALDHERGAEAAVPLAAGALADVRERWRRLAPQQPPQPLHGGDVGAAAAELAQIAGWILFDAERQRPAYLLGRQALALAGRTGDTRTQRLVLANLSMQAAHVGQPRASFRIAQSVLDGGRLTARVEALFRIRQSRALALAGRRHEAVAAIGHARGLFDEGVSDRDPNWAWWLDRHELNGHHGITHARLGDWDAAAELLRTAIDGPAAADGPTAQPPAYRVLFSTELLSVLTRAGAWREAEEVAARLVPVAGGLGSMRAAGMIGGVVGRLLRSSGGVPGAPRVPSSLRETAVCLGSALPGPLAVRSVNRPGRQGG